MIKCMVCGRKYRPGNNPISGIPNGIGLVFPKGVFNVCSICVSYNYEKAIKKAEEWRDEADDKTEGMH